MRKIVLLGLVFLPFLGNASPFPKQAEEEKSEKFCRDGWISLKALWQKSRKAPRYR